MLYLLETANCHHLLLKMFGGKEKNIQSCRLQRPGLLVCLNTRGEYRLADAVTTLYSNKTIKVDSMPFCFKNDVIQTTSMVAKSPALEVCTALRT